MEKVVPNFINIFFHPYCKKCKDPKIFIGDHRGGLGLSGVTIYCEKSKLCENLINYLKEEMDQEAKDKKEETDEQSNSKDE